MRGEDDVDDGGAFPFRRSGAIDHPRGGGAIYTGKILTVNALTTLVFHAGGEGAAAPQGFTERRL